MRKTRRQLRPIVGKELLRQKSHGPETKIKKTSVWAWPNKLNEFQQNMINALELMGLAHMDDHLVWS
jgi:hypothetical protein